MTSTQPETRQPKHAHDAWQSAARCAVWGLALALLAGCGDRKDVASQTAARVNKDEITVHQINFVLQQQRNLRPEQVDPASRQVLERLIDQQLALQKAEDAKLDRDPRVMQALEAARREVLARAYAEKVGEAAPKPTADEIKGYYEARPALFAERRIYSIQEISIEARPDQLPVLRERLSAAKTVQEFAEWLRANEYRSSANQVVRAAEQLPPASLDSFARMKDGQAALMPTPNGVQVVFLAGSRTQPLTLEQARPLVEQILVAERRRKLIDDDVKALRSAARIEYVGKFAEPAASAPRAGGAAASAVLAAPPLSMSSPGLGEAASGPAGAASSGLGAADISKGMGLK